MICGVEKKRAKWKESEKLKDNAEGIWKDDELNETGSKALSSTKLIDFIRRGN